MTKDIKREFFLFSHIDNDSVKEHLERMANKGWLLESIQYNIAKYRRIEPQDIVFSVDVYPEVSPIKRYNKKDVDYYISLCEDVGWKYITSLNNLHIFYSKKEENLIPVQTDEEYKEKILSKSIINEIVALIIILIAQINLLRINLPFDYTKLYSNMSLANLIFLPTVILILMVFIIEYLIWIIRSKNSIKKGESLPKGNYKFAKAKGIFIYGLTGLLLIFLLLAIILDSINGQRFIGLAFIPVIVSFVLGKVFKKKMETKDISIAKRFIISFVIVFASISVIAPIIFNLNNRFKPNYLPKGYIALTLNDFGINETPLHKSFTRSGSILVPRRSKYWEIYYDKSISTLHVQGRNHKIATYIFDEMLKEDISSRYDKKLTSAENDYRGFDEAYYIDSIYSEDNEKNKLYLVKGNNIFYIDSDFDLSKAENMEIVVNKIIMQSAQFK